MITGLHALIYSNNSAVTRAFLRDVLGWPYIEHTQSAPGWLIFKTGPSEMGVHPASGEYGGQSFSYPLHHSISLMCDDVEATVAELRAKGAEFNGEITDYGFGLGINLIVPEAGEMLLYEAKHPIAATL